MTKKGTALRIRFIVEMDNSENDDDGDDLLVGSTSRRPKKTGPSGLHLVIREMEEPTEWTELAGTWDCY